MGASVQFVTAALNKVDFAAESLWTCLPSTLSSIKIDIWSVIKTQGESVQQGQTGIEYIYDFWYFGLQELSGTVQFRPNPAGFQSGSYTFVDDDNDPSTPPLPYASLSEPFTGLSVPPSGYVSVDHVFGCDATTDGQQCWPHLFGCDPTDANAAKQCDFACTDTAFAGRSYLCEGDDNGGSGGGSGGGSSGVDSGGVDSGGVDSGDDIGSRTLNRFVQNSITINQLNEFKLSIEQHYESHGSAVFLETYILSFEFEILFYVIV